MYYVMHIVNLTCTPILEHSEHSGTGVMQSCPSYVAPCAQARQISIDPESSLLREEALTILRIEIGAGRRERGLP